MKNSAVHAMISNQFPNVELSDIRVVFEISVDGVYEFKAFVVDKNECREFIVRVEVTEIEGNREDE